MPRIDLDKPATLATVNGVLRSLGFTEEEVEFVRGTGDGYCYIVGTLIRGVEGGFYGSGSSVRRRTTREWVTDALLKLTFAAEWLCEDEFTARVARARAEFAAL